MYNYLMCFTLLLGVSQANKTDVKFTKYYLLKTVIHDVRGPDNFHVLFLFCEI